MQGLKIVDFSRVLAGPFATQQLADQGAEVIKVEPPGGDDTRGFGPIVNGHSTYFLCANRNKRSVQLDLKTAEGKRVAERLIEWADVLIENFRPGVMERLGLGYAVAKQLNPRLVYVAIHAFGDQADPKWTKRPGYDLVLQAMGGAMSYTGFPGQPPTKMGNSIADLVSGLYAVQAILTGVLHQRQTGEGQRIVVNMMQAQASMLAYHGTRYAVTGELEEARGNAHRGLAPYDVYACRDGWLAIGCGNDVIWTRLCDALGIEQRTEWSTNAQRLEQRGAIHEVLVSRVERYTVAELDRLLASHGVPAGPVHTLDECFQHPAVERIAVNHDVLGRFECVGPVLRTHTTRETHKAPPLLDGDRDSIMDELGFSADDVIRLGQKGAFGTQNG